MDNMISKKDILQNLINITEEEVQQFYNEKIAEEANESGMYIPDETQEAPGFSEYFGEVQVQDEPRFAALNAKLAKLNISKS